MQNEDKAWIEYRKKFSEVYDESNYSSSLQASVMRASHKLVEKAFNDQAHFGRVLEVGAGTGEHLPFVRHSFNDYTLTALDPKSAIKIDVFSGEQYRKKTDSLRATARDRESHLDFAALAGEVYRAALCPSNQQGRRQPFPTETIGHILS